MTPLQTCAAFLSSLACSQGSRCQALRWPGLHVRRSLIPSASRRWATAFLRAAPVGETGCHGLRLDVNDGYLHAFA